jgi:virginiamycin A acetyltransferase
MEELSIYIFRWKRVHEEFLIDNNIFLKHGDRVKGVHSRGIPLLFRRGDKIKIKGKVIAEEFSMMPYKGFCSVGAFSRPTCTFSNSVRIGRYCSIASRAIVMGGQHPLYRFTTSTLTYNKEYEAHARTLGGSWKIKPYSTDIGAPVIGNDVWIADDVVIKGGVTIGDGAVVAANSVVTKDIPPYAIVAGVPAKIIKYRFPDAVIKEMLRLKWWEYKFTDLPDNSRCDDIDYFIRTLSDKIENREISPVQYKKFNLGQMLSAL